MKQQKGNAAMNEEFEKQQPEQEAHASAIPEISPIPEVTPVEVPTVSTEETETENDVAETETAAVSAPTEEKEEYPNPFAPQNIPPVGLVRFGRQR